ncbi:hypothetical protein Kolga_gp20 [Pelagibacter phage Kolga EXVC016S]|nr:hypothetical protein Kolga_gp20 [Pelagibacter phage Kolga EXVC016S]
MTNARNKANIPVLNFSSTGIDDNADATAITIDSSENVGIKNTTPSNFNASARQLVVGSGSGDNGITIFAGTSNNSSLFLADGTTATNGYRGSVNYLHNGDALTLHANATETMRLTNGKVGIGVSSMTETLEVQSSVTTKVKAKTTTSSAIGGFEAWNNSSAYMKIYSYGSSASGSDFGGVANANIALFEGQGVSNVAFSTWGNAGGSNPDFIFAPQRSQKVIIKSDGKVGIGTASPSENLQVMDTSSNKPQIRIETSDGGNKRLDLYVDGSVGTIASDQSSQSLAFRTSNSERMRLTNTGLGIGTSAPTTRLDVDLSGTGETVPIVLANRNTTAGTGQKTTLGFGLSRNSGAFKSQAGTIEVGREQDWTNADANIDSYMAFSTYLNNAGTEKLRITSAGNVGIGTSSPSEKLEVNGTIKATAFDGAGRVLQVIQTVKTDAFTTTSTSMTDITGFSVSITPRSTSSKILVMVNVSMLSNNGGWGSLINLLRDSTNLTSSSIGGSADTYNAWNVGGGGGMSNNERKYNSPSISFLDSPSSTSSLTYKCQLQVNGGSTTAYFNRWGLNTDHAGVSTITVMEIQG